MEDVLACIQQNLVVLNVKGKGINSAGELAKTYYNPLISHCWCFDLIRRCSNHLLFTSEVPVTILLIVSP